MTYALHVNILTKATLTGAELATLKQGVRSALNAANCITHADVIYITHNHSWVHPGTSPTPTHCATCGALWAITPNKQ